MRERLRLLVGRARTFVPALRRRTIRMLSILGVLAGVGLVVAGVALIYAPAGFVVAGVALLGLITFDPTAARRLTWPR